MNYVTSVAGSYTGLYRALVADSNDPDNLGRVKLIVPQVTGETHTDWAWPIGGALSQLKSPYGVVYSTVSQTVTGASTATIASFTAEDRVRSVALSDGSKVSVQETGDYRVQLAAEFAVSGNVIAQAIVWIRKNGVDVPRSTRRATLQGSSDKALISTDYVLYLEAGDYLEVVFSSDNAGMALATSSAGTSPTVPATPSLTLTLHLVGTYKPQPGAAVWASFEGGDPNFPLWIGSF